MVAIVENLQNYVPIQLLDKSHHLSTGETVVVQEAKMHRCLMGGDQLTAARGRGAQSIRENGGDPISRLEGLQMFSLDWHIKMNLLEVRIFHQHIQLTFNTCI